MRLVYGTLGWHVEYLQPAIRSVENIEGLVIYFGYDDKGENMKKTLETLDKMKEICKQLDIKVFPRKLKNIFNFIKITKRIKQDIENDQKKGNEIVLFNISGGTKPTVSAALLVCVFKGIPSLYVNEETFEVIPLPLLKAEYLDTLTPKEKELAIYIIENKDDNLNQIQLTKIFNKKKSTINTQIKSLLDKGIIIFESSVDNKSKIIKPSEGIELLFG